MGGIDLQKIIHRIPTGTVISEHEFGHRHLLLEIGLALHVPAVAVIGVINGFPIWKILVAIVVCASCVGMSRRTDSHLIKSMLVSAGHMFSASALIYLSGGAAVTHLHWIVALSAIALYVDARPLAAAIAYFCVFQVTLSLIAPAALFDHSAAQRSPLIWTGLELALLFLSVGPTTISWISTAHLDDERSLADRAQEHVLRHRAMVASDVTSRTAELAEISDEARTAMQQAGQLVDSIHDGTAEVSQLVTKVAGLAEDADKLSTDTHETIEELGLQTTQIAALVRGIDEIAARTNLLALNASVEAAKAGDSGKGFAVVAQSVKALAATTSQTTDQITELTSDVSKRMQHANQCTAEVSEAVRSIAELQRKVDDSMVQQTEASDTMRKQVSEASGEMNLIIEGIGDLNELLEEDASEDPADAFNGIHHTDLASVKTS